MFLNKYVVLMHSLKQSAKTSFEHSLIVAIRAVQLIQKNDQNQYYDSLTALISDMRDILADFTLILLPTKT